eukprot:2007596-Alexandrium_andersonii.AAC.1
MAAGGVVPVPAGGGVLGALRRSRVLQAVLIHRGREGTTGTLQSSKQLRRSAWLELGISRCGGLVLTQTGCVGFGVNPVARRNMCCRVRLV